MEILDREIVGNGYRDQVDYRYKILLDMGEMPIDDPSNRETLYKLLDWNLRESGLSFATELLDIVKTEISSSYRGVLLYVSGRAHMKVHHEPWRPRYGRPEYHMRSHPPIEQENVDKLMRKKKDCEEVELLLLIEGN